MHTTEVAAGVFELVVDRPPLNILDSALQRELTGVLVELRARESLLALIVRGGGERAFSVGADIKEIDTEFGRDPWGGARLEEHWTSVLSTMPFLTVACVDGACLGGGLELALCTDFRVASERAAFGFPEVRLGLVPGMGGTARLPALIGRAWATRLVMTGETVDAKRALQIGLVQELSLDPRRTCLALAQSLRGSGRAAQRSVKALVRSSVDGPALQRERQAWLALLDTDERREGTAAFREHRRPEFGA